MIHSMCEAYGWSFKEAMSNTLPQMILFNHASQVCYKKAKIKSENTSENNMTADKITVRGKTLDKLNSDELAAYYGAGEGFGSIIEL